MLKSTFDGRVKVVKMNHVRYLVRMFRSNPTYFVLVRTEVLAILKVQRDASPDGNLVRQVWYQDASKTFLRRKMHHKDFTNLMNPQLLPKGVNDPMFDLLAWLTVINSENLRDYPSLKPIADALWKRVCVLVKAFRESLPIPAGCTLVPLNDELVAFYPSLDSSVVKRLCTSSDEFRASTSGFEEPVRQMERGHSSLNTTGGTSSKNSLPTTGKCVPYSPIGGGGFMNGYWYPDDDW